jgi:hypothetical protein
MTDENGVTPQVRPWRTIRPPARGPAVAAVARLGVGQLFKAIIKEAERRARAGA